MDEFSLIKSYFYNAENQALFKDKNIRIGPGDDAAVFDLAPGLSLVSSMDTLLEGVHFPQDTPAGDIAYKSLAVNLSDLAAMGAEPHSYLMSLTLPEINQIWLEEFAEGMFEISNTFGLALIGGDMSRGPLSISVQINGTLAQGEQLTRSAAKPGDLICVSAYLGLGSLGLKVWQDGDIESYPSAKQRFLRPEPRVELAAGLYELGVKACIDVSDGLLAELNHLCQASQLGAVLDINQAMLHPELSHLESSTSHNMMLAGGDDYELCFAICPSTLPELERYFEKVGLPLSVLGEFVEDGERSIRGPNGALLELAQKGYNHFK